MNSVELRGGAYVAAPQKSEAVILALQDGTQSGNRDKGWGVSGVDSNGSAPSGETVNGAGEGPVTVSWPVPLYSNCVGPAVDW